MDNEQSDRAARDNETLERLVETLRLGAVDFDEEARDAANDRNEGGLTAALVNASSHRELANLLHGMRSDVRSGLFRQSAIVACIRTIERRPTALCEFGTPPASELLGIGNTLATLGHAQLPCNAPATHELKAKEQPVTCRRFSCTSHLTPMIDRLFLEAAFRYGIPPA